MDSFSSTGILLQTKPKKWNRRNTRCAQNNGEINAKSSDSEGVSGGPEYRFTHSLQNKANANAVEDAWKLQYAALVHSQRMGISY